MLLETFDVERFEKRRHRRICSTVRQTSRRRNNPNNQSVKKMKVMKERKLIT
ncbi:hypothetical protein [Staphylococcus hominis]|uniref:hypothetical protein n=1 Tax=Staphylococcus hominis TaxID=1290 RepID=UPI0016436864|nr:hypothetical protein [Staphylococcus hominis]